jgi:hypothetical protein
MLPLAPPSVTVCSARGTRDYQRVEQQIRRRLAAEPLLNVDERGVRSGAGGPEPA